MKTETPSSNNNSNTPSGEQEFVKKTKYEVYLSKLKRRVLKHLWVVRGLLIALGLLVVFLFFLLFQNLFIGSDLQRYLKLAGDFVFVPTENVRTFEGRTNLVILGKGGAGHEAPDLTDTIIFTSINIENEEVDLISLPRDIWIASLRAKLNSIYYWGEQKQEGSGGVLVKSVVEEIVGEPVHYYAVVDFNGFVEIINVVDGINVNVKEAFVDEYYPIPGKEDDECGGDPELRCRYETIEFKKGPQEMDGETALKFVRSRRAEGDEGTDLARAERQQVVLKAVKDRVLSREVLLSPKKLLSIKEVLVKNTETDIEDSTAVVLLRWLFESRNAINSHPIPEEILFNPPYIPKYDNLYVFVPKDEDWSSFQEWVDCIIGKECG